MNVVPELYLKIIYRVIGVFKLFGWKTLYGSNIKIGHNTFFYPKSYIMLEHTGRITVGDNCFFNRGCSIASMGKIVVGDNCIFGENVKFYDHNHKTELNGKPFNMQGYSIGSIVLENNVWVGSDTIILPNVHIGKNVVIAAGSVVTKSIPDNTIFIQKRTVMEESR